MTIAPGESWADQGRRAQRGRAFAGTLPRSATHSSRTIPGTGTETGIRIASAPSPCTSRAAPPAGDTTGSSAGASPRSGWGCWTGASSRTLPIRGARAACAPERLRPRGYRGSVGSGGGGVPGAGTTGLRAMRRSRTARAPASRRPGESGGLRSTAPARRRSDLRRRFAGAGCER